MNESWEKVLQTHDWTDWRIDRRTEINLEDPSAELGSKIIFSLVCSLEFSKNIGQTISYYTSTWRVSVWSEGKLKASSPTKTCFSR